MHKSVSEQEFKKVNELVLKFDKKFQGAIAQSFTVYDLVTNLYQLSRSISEVNKNAHYVKLGHINNFLDLFSKKIEEPNPHYEKTLKLNYAPILGTLAKFYNKSMQHYGFYNINKDAKSIIDKCFKIGASNNYENITENNFLNITFAINNFARDSGFNINKDALTKLFADDKINLIENMTGKQLNDLVFNITGIAKHKLVDNKKLEKVYDKILDVQFEKILEYSEEYRLSYFTSLRKLSQNLGITDKTKNKEASQPKVDVTIEKNTSEVSSQVAKFYSRFGKK